MTDNRKARLFGSDRKILLKWGEAFRARAGVRGGAPLGA